MHALPPMELQCFSTSCIVLLSKPSPITHFAYFEANSYHNCMITVNILACSVLKTFFIMGHFQCNGREKRLSNLRSSQLMVGFVSGLSLHSPSSQNGLELILDIASFHLWVGQYVSPRRRGLKTSLSYHPHT